jgi:lipoprotein-anchoring transpeptidase ErfK/SrfK
MGVSQDSDGAETVVEEVATTWFSRLGHPHWFVWLGAGVAILLLASAVDLPLAYRASNHLQQERAGLTSTWDHDQRSGVSVAALTKLRQELKQVHQEAWWSPGFWTQSPQAALTRLQQATTATWSKALGEGRHTADLDLHNYRRFVGKNASWLSPEETQGDAHWSAELAQASTPGRIQSLAARWASKLNQAQQAVKASQAAAAAAVAAAKGTKGLLGQATALGATAKSDGISQLAVPEDASLLQQALASGKSGLAESGALSQQLSALQAEIGLDQQVAGLKQSVMELVDQAAFEEIPGYTAFLAQYQAADGAFRASQTPAQMDAVLVSLTSLEQGVQPALESNSCGHTSYSGKSIYISLTWQEMIFYDNGCEVNATPVTTGRPGESTPTGTFSIFLKASPLEFVSGYGPGSPNYYTPFLASYAMEFLSGGYYIHNAPWEPADAFGPGSEDDLAVASHGCVHTPIAALAWAYSWTSTGTPVVVSG